MTERPKAFIDSRPARLLSLAFAALLTLTMGLAWGEDMLALFADKAPALPETTSVEESAPPANPARAAMVMLRHAGKHASPNAGWPEAAMAGALDIAIAGPRAYPGYTVNDPFINESGQKQYGAAMIDRALKLLSGSCVLLGLLIVSLAIAHSLAV